MNKLRTNLILLLTTLTLLCTHTVSYAQMQKGFGFGVRGGVNFSDYTGSTGDSRIGFLAGVYTDYYVAPKFGLELGAYYSSQGTINNIEPGTLSGRVDNLIDYAQLQFGIKWHFIQGFRVFATAQGGLVVNAKKRFYADDLKQVVPLEGINKFDVGIVAGVGYTFRFGLDLQASYVRGFIPVFNDGGNFTSNYRLTIGWRFIGSGGHTPKNK